MWLRGLSLMKQKNPRKRIDLVGQKFGRLVVLQFIDKNKWRSSFWLCRCDCGKEKIILGDSLKNGDTKSCGCLNIEKLTKHGHCNKNGKSSEIYAIWQSMIQRCTNPNHKAYYNYGGRGITVCKRWKNSFENFFKDMGESPKGYSIDRIDNDDNYCKSNCRWVTRKEQMRNTRRNRLITHKKKTQCLIEWAEETKIPYPTLWQRIFKLGWSIEKALTIPVQKRKKASV
ncbi:hypothetical protein LCGC14_1152420 [marine sediment metagenome]|uniref:Uncharacterized protein n=1 Tax=marine sediment metagenome TaxID=412755 RepID=A0A0F9Q0M7_9ZZZZ